jgi:hypothetical protein
MPVTAAEFRRMALSFPETVEGSHMGHANFRVGGKIFASLSYPNPEHGMVKLSPSDQARFVDPETEAFMPAAAAWGRQGSTTVKLEKVSNTAWKDAMQKAWLTTASKQTRKKANLRQ